MTTKTAALLLGIVFILVGILGFFPNPIIGTVDAVFHSDAVHNSVHLVSGALFVIFALAAPERAGGFMKIFGIVYFLIGVLGLAMVGDDGMARLLGFLHVNGPDNYLHIVLGVVIFLASMLPQPVAAPPDRR